MHQSYLGQILLVGLGGFVGSGARFALSGLVHRIFSGGAFPHGTLAVNVLGCLALSLAQGSDLLRAAFNVIAHMILGLGAAWLGYLVSQNL